MNAKNNFAIGTSDFKEIVDIRATLVDKTLFIKEIMEDLSKVILLTRPRRFGKTLAMSMLSYFLNISEKDIFGGLKIKDHPEFCARHQNKYPVIFLTFKDIKPATFEGVITKLKGLFAQTYKQYSYLLEGNTLSSAQKKDFKRIVDKKVHDTEELSSALSNLMGYLHKHHGIAPIVILDEYDMIIQESYIKGYYDKIIPFMRDLFGSAFKDNKDLGKAVLTGITRVSQESLFSGLNNVRVYTMLDPDYGQYFGFTEDEVRALLPPKDDISPIRKWYNGYHIGGYQLYNPWSIANYFNSKCRFDIYWVSTSNNALVRELLSAKPALKEQCEELIRGVSTRKILEKSLAFPDIHSSADAVWTLLIHTGYLHATSLELDEDGNLVGFLSIPNFEIRNLYLKIIKSWFIPEDAETQVYEDFVDSLREGKIEEFTKHIEYCLSSLSYFDMDKRTPEKIYHSFMSGIFMRMNHTYDITSNREAGDGRYDVRISPKDHTKRGFLIEFKTASKPENLEKAADSALEQITAQDYTQGMKAADILCLGMAFCGKKVVSRYKIVKATT